MLSPALYPPAEGGAGALMCIGPGLCLLLLNHSEVTPLTHATTV